MVRTRDLPLGPRAGRRPGAGGQVAPQQPLFLRVSIVGFFVSLLSDASQFSNRRVDEEPVAIALAVIRAGQGNDGDRSSAPAVYRALQMLPSGAVIELPALRREAAKGFDSRYQFWSTTHWGPLINGYSGTAPASYVETQQRMQTFPDAQSLDRLYQLKARHVIVHEQLFPRGAGADVLAATRGQAGLVSRGRVSRLGGHRRDLRACAIEPGGWSVTSLIRQQQGGASERCTSGRFRSPRKKVPGHGQKLAPVLFMAGSSGRL
jgi:hypothetical protein